MDVEKHCTAFIRNIPECMSEIDFLPNMLTGGSLNWEWKNDKIVAINIMRVATMMPGRKYINCGGGIYQASKVRGYDQVDKSI